MALVNWNSTLSVNVREIDEQHKGFLLTRLDRALRSARSNEHRLKEANAALAREALGRRMAEEALKQSEKDYRHLTENATDIVWSMDLSGRLTYVSPSFFTITGFKPEERYGLSLAEAIPETEAAKLLERINSELGKPPTERQPSLQLEISRPTKDGRTVVLEVNVSWMVDETGKPIGVQGISRDITARKQAEQDLEKSQQKLQDSESRFRSLFNSSPIGIVILGLDGRILDANRAILRMSGYDLHDLRETDLMGLIHHRYADMVKRWMKDIVPGFICDNPLEIEALTQDGSSLPLSVKGWVITGKESQPVALGAFVQDISEQKSMEEERRRLVGQLQQAQKMEAIGTLAGGIAHDFNNLLGGMLGYGELALSRVPADAGKLRKYVNGVLTTGQRAQGLVQQILQFSRREERAKVPSDLRLIVQEVASMMRSTLPVTVQVLSKSQVAKDDLVLADASQLHQVLMNLCVNGSHAMPDSTGTLTIALDKVTLDHPKQFLTMSISAGDYIRLTVHDTGRGLPPQVTNRIFEPYFTTKAAGEGTGLGLSVSLGIVKDHKGLIEVESTPGRGTSFFVYLPLLESDAEPVRPEPPNCRRGNQEHILVVDDEAFFLDVVHDTLEDSGYRVTVCRSSRKALEAVRAKPEGFDAVVTDLTMPDLTGLQLSTEIAAINAQLPIILCSGYSDKIDALNSRHPGIVSCLTKPVTREDLTGALYRALNEKSQSSENIRRLKVA